MESTRSEEETQTRSSSNLSTATVKESAIPETLGEHKDTESQQVSGAEAKKLKTQRILTFVGLQLALFLAALDGYTFHHKDIAIDPFFSRTIVSTALPRIGSDFNQMAIVAWVATAYMLTFDAFRRFLDGSHVSGSHWYC